MAKEGDPPQDGPSPAIPEKTVDVTQTVKIKVAGKEFDVPPELATAYEVREQEFQRKVSQQGEELGTLRKFKQEAEPILTQARTTSQPQGPNLNVLWYENPEAAAQLVEERIARKLQAQYLQAEGIKSFWTDFYREHKDLADDDFVVKAKFSELYGELAPLTIREASTRLAESTREELLRISRKMKRTTTQPNRSGELEEASGQRAPKPTPEELEEAAAPKSVSALIAQRRQARRQSAKS